MATNKVVTLDDLKQFAINLKNKFINQNTLKDKADKSTTLAGYGITDAYNKTEADDLLIEKSPLDNYEVITTPDPLQADKCVFNFYKKQDTFTRITEKRLFNAYFPDPLGGGSMWGTIETTQMCRGGGGALYIEQVATRHQGSEPGKLHRFIRKGYVASISNPYTGVTSASITWGSWKPLDYPSYLISGTESCRVSVKGGFCYLAIIGNLTPTGSEDIRALFTVPAAVRPPFEVHTQIQNAYGQVGGAVQTIWMGTNGVVNVWGAGYSWQNIRGSFQYPIDL